MRKWEIVAGLGLLIGIGVGLWTTHVMCGYWLTRPGVADEAAELGDPEWRSSFAAQVEGDFIHIDSVAEHEQWARYALPPCYQWLNSDCLDGRILKMLPTPAIRKVDRELLVRLLGALGFSGSCGNPDLPSAQCWQLGTLVRIGRDEENWFVVSVRSGEIHDDARWFVEAILRETTNGSIEVVRRVSFMFDTAGFEGLDWRLVTPVASVLAMGLIALGFQVVRVLQRSVGRS